MNAIVNRSSLWSLLVIASGLLFAAPAVAQNRISGRVIDPQGNPAAGIEVLLHALTEASGSEVDKDTSRADGSFEVVAANADAKAIYFVAVAHEGQLYIGDLMRAPFPTDQEYVVQIGVNPVDFGAGATGMAPAQQPEARERTAGLVVIMVSALVISGVLFVLMRRRVPARRRWLLELARLEDELADASPPADTLLERRAQLRNRLLGQSS